LQAPKKYETISSDTNVDQLLDISSFTYLKNFMRFIRQKYQDAILNDKHFQIEYFKQYL